MQRELQSIFFQTELLFVSIRKYRLGKDQIRKLYNKMFEPGQHHYENLELQTERPTLSTKHDEGRSICQFGPDYIRIEEDNTGCGADDFARVDRLTLRRGLFIQRSQTIDDFRGKGARLDDTFCPFADLRQIGRVALKPSQRCPGIIGCGRDGLCEIVRDGGDQFSHRADPARMGKIRPELFSIFAIFNVVPHCTPLHDLASVIAQRPGARLEPAIDSV